MRFMQVLAATTILVALSACAPEVVQRGHAPEAEKLDRIEIGQHRKADIASLLGSPSSQSLFGPDTWYYVASTKEFFAFYAPEELERTVVEIGFDDGGTVSSMRVLGLQDGREVQLVSRETPTAGNDMTVLQQLLGNLGRFTGDQGQPHWERGPGVPGR